jgi:maltose/maltodextrin transport system permease protein
MNPNSFKIRHLLVALAFLPALYLDFILYQSANIWIALGLLIVIALGLYVYLAKKAYTYRYLFPGLLGFALFVILPLIYTVYIGFTKYSSQNLLPYDRALSLLEHDTFLTGDAAYIYMLYAQGGNRYIAYLEDEKDASKRYASTSFELIPGQQNESNPATPKLTPVQPNEKVPGTPLRMSQITREKLFIPMRDQQLKLPDGSLLGLEGLRKFTSRERLWAPNNDGSLTNKKDGTIIRPDFKQGFFANEKGEKVGVGFRTFSGLENYVRIFSDPRIQTPFLRIFIWNVAFAGLSVLFSFALGMFLSLLLNWKEMKFRQTYRTLLILPYAVPSVLSILILKGMFSQEFGAVNEVLRSIFHWAPEWETNPWDARAMILIVNVWLGYPYMMLVCTGLLQSIPSALYEAAAIDGSTPVTNFSRITLPLLIPPLFPILIASFAFNFNNYSLIHLLTGGTPRMMGGGIAGETDILVSYTMHMAFTDSGSNYGLASAIATIIFIIVGTLSWVNLKIGSRKRWRI